MCISSSISTESHQREKKGTRTKRGEGDNWEGRKKEETEEQKEEKRHNRVQWNSEQFQLSHHIYSEVVQQLQVCGRIPKQRWRRPAGATPASVRGCWTVCCCAPRTWGTWIITCRVGKLLQIVKSESLNGVIDYNFFQKEQNQTKCIKHIIIKLPFRFFFFFYKTLYLHWEKSFVLQFATSAPLLLCLRQMNQKWKISQKVQGEELSRKMCEMISFLCSQTSCLCCSWRCGDWEGWPGWL